MERLLGSCLIDGVDVEQQEGAGPIERLGDARRLLEETPQTQEFQTRVISIGRYLPDSGVGRSPHICGNWEGFTSVL